MGAPLAGGAHRGWPLAVLELGVLSGAVLWIAGMARHRRLEWRRTSLDLPLALLLALVLAQLALGNAPLVRWALAPASGDPDASAILPALPLIGTVSPSQTARSLRLFLAYAGVYVLVVNLVRTRRGLDRLVRTLLIAGGVLGFAGLLDYLAGEAWLSGWGARAPRPRLSGTFVNPDHFAAWLEMLICLGVGYVLARSRSPGAGAADPRERLARRLAPMIGIGVMALALVFTLSRGGIASLVLALGALLALEGMRGHARASLVVVGSLLALTAGYAAWIGFAPLLARLSSDQYGGRLSQLASTFDMLRAFPLLGVGLGAYRDIYFRYQPPELLPGKVYFPFAHDDWAQLAVELGLPGAAIVVFAGWRVGRDLVAAHLLGRGRCPVGAGEDEGARRRGWGAGIGLGGVAAVVAMLVHSALDFGARIPANGVLAAACLGIATVALHTRSGSGADRWLAAVRAVTLGNAWTARAAAAAAVAAALSFVWPIARAPLVESTLDGKAPAGERVARALRWAPRDAEARWARARHRIALGRQVWESGQTADGRILASWPERRREALADLEGAIEDLRVAIAARPSDPFLHETLGWAHGNAAAIDEQGGVAHRAAAFASLRRAIALQPENPYLYRSLAAVALGQREPVLPVALAAARQAVARDPALLPDLADRFLSLGLTPAQWSELVPDSPADRLDLAFVLDGAGLGPAAETQYRRAAELDPGSDAFARWALARSLLRRGDPARALAELDAARRAEPDNPEVELLRARALDARQDPAALDAYRAAVAAAEARAARPGADPLPFRAAAARSRTLVARALGEGERGVPRYRRALAELLIERKLWAQSAREWELLIAEAPRDAAAHHGLALALAGLGKPAEALDEHRRAVALDGRSAAFRMALARSLWDSEQFYQAMNEWQFVLNTEPGNVDARLALANAYVRAGDRAAALAELERVLLLSPDNAEARRALGRLGRASAG